MNKSYIGIDSSRTSDVANLLNRLLADYQILYMNTRGYHWNIKGPCFFELHNKFEEVYTDLLNKIDEIAERILTIGHTPMHTYTDYLKDSDIKSDKNAVSGTICVQGLVDGINILLAKQRETIGVADDASDEGTASLMSDYIGEQEKLLWMLNAYLS